MADTPDKCPKYGYERYKDTSRRSHDLIADLRRQLAAMTAERDAWQAALGLGLEITPLEAGRKVDEWGDTITELRAAMEKVPKTADGAAVGYGDNVYLLRGGKIEEVGVSEMALRDGEWLVMYDWDCWSLADECYSTREAANAESDEASRIVASNAGLTDHAIACLAEGLLGLTIREEQITPRVRLAAAKAYGRHQMPDKEDSRHDL